MNASSGKRAASALSSRARRFSILGALGATILLVGGLGGSQLVNPVNVAYTETTAVSVADISVNEGNAGTTVAAFTITRSGDTGASSTVKYTTSGGTATAGTDYTAVPLTATSFAPGETAKTVNVNVAGDTLPEGNETFNLVLSAPTGAIIADTTGIATIRNDDGTAYVAVDSVSVLEGSSGTVAATFNITRSGNTTGSSTVSYKTSGGTAIAGTDYTALPLTTVTFAAGETTKSVTVNVIGDTVDEVNETFNLVLSTPVKATISDTSGAATIVDDDGPVTAGPATFVSVGDISVNEGNVGTTAATFTITRSGDTAASSTVKYKTTAGTATAGSDYTDALLTTLSFAPGETTKTVNVDVIGDTRPEGGETFNLVLSAPTGANIADNTGIATILNDDGSAFLSVNDVSVVEGNVGYGSTTPVTFTITRSGTTTGSSTVSYKTSGGTATAGTDYTSVPLTTVTFTAGQTTKTVTVNVIGDTVVEPNEKFNLVLSAPAGATLSDASGGATIVNDD